MIEKPKHPKFVDLTGLIFNRLIVMRYVGLNKHGKSVWECHCECGKVVHVIGSKLRSGHTKSCGCYVRDINSVSQGMSLTPIYAVWKAMRQRCQCPTSQSWGSYGGRGISVCKRWEDFNLFLEDMGPSYEKGLELDRIDNNGNYCPENCRWTNRTVQCRNTRRNVMVDTWLGRMPVSQASSVFGLPLNRIRKAVREGRSIPELTGTSSNE